MTFQYSIKIILFVLFLTITLQAQQIFPFGTTKSEIEKNHTLSELHIDILDKNIKTFYSNKDSKEIDFFVFDDLKKEKICNLNFFYFLGFYKDSLFAIIASTDELPANFKLKNKNCLNNHFFLSDSIQSISFVRKTSLTTGGNIFGEAGSIIKSSDENRYIVELISNGMSVFSPSHQQYAFIILSKNIIDKLNSNIKFHNGYKLKIKSSEIFETSLYDSIDFSQKQKKE